MLLRTFFNRLHGYHIQYNVVSRETLLAAQKHPEKHRDLIVRVAGYSTFTMYYLKQHKMILSKEQSTFCRGCKKTQNVQQMIFVQ